MRGERGKRLQKLRSELTERSFAHLYETGGMRRVHLKGRENILKRLVVHAAGFNLGLVMRRLIGVGKPRRLQGLGDRIFELWMKFWRSGRCLAAIQAAIIGRTPSTRSFLGAVGHRTGICFTPAPV